MAYSGVGAAEAASSDTISEASRYIAGLPLSRQPARCGAAAGLALFTSATSMAAQRSLMGETPSASGRSDSGPATIGGGDCAGDVPRLRRCEEGRDVGALGGVRAPRPPPPPAPGP